MFRYFTGAGAASVHGGAEDDAAGGGTGRLCTGCRFRQLSLWGSDAFYRVHLTYTHPLAGLILVALLLAAIESRWIKTLSFSRLLGLNLVGGSIHLCGDMIALWSLRILWPFSEYDFVLKWTSDFDYVVLAVVVVATGLSETAGLQHRAPWIIAVGFLLLFAYFLLIPGWGAA